MKKDLWPKKHCKVCDRIIDDKYQFCRKHNPNSDAFEKTDVEASNKYPQQHVRINFYHDEAEDGGD